MSLTGGGAIIRSLGNRTMVMEEYEDLVTATEAFPSVKEKKLIFISKSGFTEAVQRRAEEEGMKLADELV